MVVVAWLIIPAGILALAPFPPGGLVRLRLLVGWLGTSTFIVEGLILSWILGNAIGLVAITLAYVAWTLAPIAVLYGGLRLARLQKDTAQVQLRELRR